jgi:glycolate oxidase iron-sulfur subunit
MRRLLAAVMPYPARFRWLLRLARLVRPLAPLLPERLGAALALVPRREVVSRSAPPSPSRDAPGEAPAPRVALLAGCVQSVLGAGTNAATERLLARMGCEQVTIDGCCGSLTHHLGRTGATRDFGAQFAAQVAVAHAESPLDAVVVNASGCGTHLKDYGFVFREDAALATSAARVSELTRDICEFVAARGLPPVVNPGQLRVAYHSACSLQHGQHVHAPPRDLLRAAGFTVIEIPEGHVCCGSAGTYNMLQPGFARRLAERKLAQIARLDIDVIAAGNLGCMTQLASGATKPIVHTVELLDWATGGPVPPALLR